MLILALFVEALAFLLVGMILMAVILGVFSLVIVKEVPEEGREERTIPTKIDVKKKHNIFLSYSEKDSRHFNISQIAESLEKYDNIDKVFYWEELSGQNVVEYLERTLNKTDIFIPFFSENAKKSQSVKDEWHMAMQLRKKIVPVLEREEDIPLLLMPYQNVKFIAGSEMKGFIRNLYHKVIEEKDLQIEEEGRMKIKKHPKPESDLDPERTPDSKEDPKPKRLEAPRKLEDLIFTAAYPGCLRPEIWYSFLIYLHLPRNQKEAQKNVDRKKVKLGFHPTVSTFDFGIKMPRGSVFEFIPRAANVIFNPESQKVIWLEDYHEIEFRVKNLYKVNEVVIDTGRVDVFVEKMLIAQIPFSLKISNMKED